MGVRNASPYAKIITVATPAVATEAGIVAPGQGLWRVISLTFRFVTDVNVANRGVTLFADDGSTVWWRASAAAVQAASLTVDHSAFAGAATSTLTGSVATLALPSEGLWLEPGWRLRTLTSLIQAGDQYSAIAALVEEFPNGPREQWSPTVARAEYDRS